MSKSKKLFFILLLLVVVGAIIIPFIRGPQSCPRGGVLAMTGNDCGCLGHWYETRAPRGFDDSSEGMCVGYRL